MSPAASITPLPDVGLTLVFGLLELLDIWQSPDMPVKNIVLVTHIIEEAIELADRIIVLASGPGRIAADIRVELPRPRDRRTEVFNNLTDKVFSLIEERA